MDSPLDHSAISPVSRDDVMVAGAVKMTHILVIQSILASTGLAYNPPLPICTSSTRNDFYLLLYTYQSEASFHPPRPVPPRSCASSPT